MSISIKPISSSSSGNCYFISDGQYSLLIEAGITISKIRNALNFKLHNVDGCLLSHSHSDHSRAIPSLLSAGIDCLMSIGTANAIGVLNHRRCYTTKATWPTIFAGWNIMPFATVHDCAEPLGFLIQSKVTNERLLFATDTAYIRHRFNGLNYIMVECNNSEAHLKKSVEEGHITMSQYSRIVGNHFSLENVVEFLKANDLSAVKEIHLMHLSDSNSHEEDAVKTIRQLTGLPVFSCAK